MRCVMSKPDFCLVTAQLISAFVFAIRIVHFLIFLIPKFQAYSHLLYVDRLVFVRPDPKPQRPVFSCCGSYKCANSEITVYSCLSGSLCSNLIILKVKKIKTIIPIFFFLL